MLTALRESEAINTVQELDMSDCEFGQAEAQEALARLIAEAPALRRLTLNRQQGEAIIVERQAALKLVDADTSNNTDAAANQAGPDSMNIVPGVVEIKLASTGTQVCSCTTYMTQELVVTMDQNQ